MLCYTAYNKGVGSQDSVVDVPRTRRNKVPLSASRRCQQALAVAWRVEIGFVHRGSQFVLPGRRTIGHARPRPREASSLGTKQRSAGLAQSPHRRVAPLLYGHI